jgi:hypothetical protein
MRAKRGHRDLRETNTTPYSRAGRVIAEVLLAPGAGTRPKHAIPKRNELVRLGRPARSLKVDPRLSVHIARKWRRASCFTIARGLPDTGESVGCRPWQFRWSGVSRRRLRALLRRMAMQSLRAWVALLNALTFAALIFAAPALAQEGEASSGVLRSAILLLWAQVLLLLRSEIGLLSSLVTQVSRKGLEGADGSRQKGHSYDFPWCLDVHYCCYYCSQRRIKMRTHEGP